MRDVVSVILDRVIDQGDLVEQAKGEATTSKARLQAAARKVMAMGDQEAARALWREAFTALVLAESSKHARKAIENARASLRAEVKAVRAVGVDRLKEIPALKNADIMARRAERAGLAAPAP